MTFKKGNKIRLDAYISEETRQRLRQASLGRKHSEETRQKLRLVNLGKKREPFSEETRRKMSLAKKVVNLLKSINER